MDRHTTGSLPIQTNDSQGKVKSLYWLSLRLDQQQPQAQGGSDRGPLDSQWGWLQQWPWASGGYASSSTAPHAGRCPGGSMMGVNEPWPGAQQPLLGSLPGWGAHSHTLAWPQFSQPCLPIGPALLPGGEPMCASVGAGGHLTSLNLLQGNVLRWAARWARSSSGSFRLFWSSLRLSSTASPAALPLRREMSSGGSVWPPCPLPPAKPHPHPTLTHRGRARGRGPQLASGLAWKRLSPRWRELGLASSRMVKLACSLGK